jgi:hypothetical protein
MHKSKRIGIAVLIGTWSKGSYAKESGVLVYDMHRFVRIHQGHTIKTIVYSEVDVLKWRGQPPKVELVYDETMRFLLKVAFHLNRSETRVTPQV